MKIRSVEPIEVAAPAGESSSPWSSTVILVKVTTANGAVGWGEAPTTLMTAPVRESVREVARFYEGRDLEQHAAALRSFEVYSFYHGPGRWRRRARSPPWTSPATTWSDARRGCPYPPSSAGRSAGACGPIRTAGTPTVSSRRVRGKGTDDGSLGIPRSKVRPVRRRVSARSRRKDSPAPSPGSGRSATRSGSTWTF